MTFWTAIFGIVVVTCLAGVINGYLRSRNPRSNRQLQDRVDKLSANVTDVAERVKTLERITTDSQHSLKREFAELDRS